MRMFGVLTSALALWSWEVAAQPAASDPLALSFRQLLDGRHLEAEAGFYGASLSASEGSAERLIASQGAELARRLSKGSWKRGELERVAAQDAFSLLLARDWERARASFLSLAAAAPAESQAREIAYTFAELARSAPELVVAPAPVERAPGSLPAPFGPGAASAPVTAPPERSLVSGKAELFIDGAAFGVFSAVTLASVSGIGDEEAEAPLVSLLAIGGAAGGGLLSYAYLRAKGGDISTEEVGPVTLGGMMGAGQGLFTLSLLGILDGEATDAREAIGTVWLTTTAGFAVGGLASAFATPSRGDVFLVGSSAAWGTGVSLGVLGIVQVENAEIAVQTLNVGYAAGAVGGILLANQVDLSRKRIRRINRTGAIGLAGGAALGGLVAAAFSDDNGDGALSAFSTTMLLGGLGGLMYGAYSTADWDAAPSTGPGASPLSLRGISPTRRADGGMGVEASFSF